VAVLQMAHQPAESRRGHGIVNCINVILPVHNPPIVLGL
jgi:hypothetical protein